MAEPLLDMAVRLRERTGRVTTPEDVARITAKVAGLSPSEIAFERSALRRMLGAVPTPIRNVP